MIDLRKEKAFKMVYEHYYDYIYNYFYYHTFQREVTEDLTSITFMKVLEKGNLYDEEKAKVVTWLLTIAKMYGWIICGRRGKGLYRWMT